MEHIDYNQSVNQSITQSINQFPSSGQPWARPESCHQGQDCRRAPGWNGLHNHQQDAWGEDFSEMKEIINDHLRSHLMGTIMRKVVDQPKTTWDEAVNDLKAVGTTVTKIIDSTLRCNGQQQHQSCSTSNVPLPKEAHFKTCLLQK